MVDTMAKLNDTKYNYVKCVYMSIVYRYMFILVSLQHGIFI